MENAKKIYTIDDRVEMKKHHPCGTNNWKIIRIGMEVRIKCLGCSRSILLPRNEFEKKLKKIIDSKLKNLKGEN